MAVADKFEAAHQADIATLQRRIDKIYKKLAEDAAVLASRIPAVDPDRVFSFADYPATQRQVTYLFNELQNQVEGTVTNGIFSQWALANRANDALVHDVFGKLYDDIPDELSRRYLTTNNAARDAFASRKVAGLNLSQRIWRYTEQCKEELELALDAGLRTGKPAAAMSRDVRQCLKEPNLLFRRVRENHQKDAPLILSRRARAYNPGRGVYRSSYKNALRLTATETNIAYRTADHLRWQQMDFVVGIEVRRSFNHPIEDICDELSGTADEPVRYPKTFKFTGWHPFCRCYAVPVLKTRQELQRDVCRIDDGQEPLPSSESVNAVPGLPGGFTDWLDANADRIAVADSLPYFIRDNKELIPAYKQWLRNSDVNYALRLGRKAEKGAQVAVKESKTVSEFSPEQLNNFLEIERVINIKRGEPMSFNDADHGLANLIKDKANCAGCVLAHELRLRGFDVTATAYSETDGSPQKLLASDTLTGWLTKKMVKPTFSNRIPENAKNFGNLVNASTAVLNSRYTFEWDNEGARNGHIIFAERTSGGLYLYDPQGNYFWGITEVQNAIKRGSTLNILRIDRLIFNPQTIKGLFSSLNRR